VGEVAARLMAIAARWWRDPSDRRVGLLAHDFTDTQLSAVHIKLLHVL